MPADVTNKEDIEDTCVTVCVTFLKWEMRRQLALLLGRQLLPSYGASGTWLGLSQEMGGWSKHCRLGKCPFWSPHVLDLSCSGLSIDIGMKVHCDSQMFARLIRMVVIMAPFISEANTGWASVTERLCARGWALATDKTGSVCAQGNSSSLLLLTASKLHAHQ